MHTPTLNTKMSQQLAANFNTVLFNDIHIGRYCTEFYELPEIPYEKLSQQRKLLHLQTQRTVSSDLQYNSYSHGFIGVKHSSFWQKTVVTIYSFAIWRQMSCSDKFIALLLRNNIINRLILCRASNETKMPMQYEKQWCNRPSGTQDTLVFPFAVSNLIRQAFNCSK